MRALSVVICAAATTAIIGWASSASAAARDYTCTVADVTVFPDRVHVRCDAASSDGIWFFAISTFDAMAADRLLALGTSALMGNKRMYFRYETDANNVVFFPVPGCGSSNCRVPHWFGLQ